MNDDWINPDAAPNGIGFVCRHCDRLIDWHPVDHGRECPEYRDWCSCGPRCGIPVGVHEPCVNCGGLITWEDFPFANGGLVPKGSRFVIGEDTYQRAQTPEPPPLSVSWDHTVNPPVPLVITDCIYLQDRDDSLRMMWAEIERLRGSGK